MIPFRNMQLFMQVKVKLPVKKRYLNKTQMTSSHYKRQFLTMALLFHLVQHQRSFIWVQTGR